MREATVKFATVDTARDDEATPHTELVIDRDAAVNPKYNETFVVPVPRDQQAKIRMGPAHVRFSLAYATADGRVTLRVKVDLNLWSTTRSQYEDQLIWIDYERDRYLKILTMAGTATVTWTSGWTSLSDHHHDSERTKSHTLPDFPLPFLGQPQPPHFADGY